MYFTMKSFKQPVIFLSFTILFFNPLTNATPVPSFHDVLAELAEEPCNSKACSKRSVLTTLESYLPGMPPIAKWFIDSTKHSHSRREAMWGDHSHGNLRKITPGYQPPAINNDVLLFNPQNSH
jgi:hypothetical protein